MTSEKDVRRQRSKTRRTASCYRSKAWLQHRRYSTLQNMWQSDMSQRGCVGSVLF